MRFESGEGHGAIPEPRWARLGPSSKRLTVAKPGFVNQAGQTNMLRAVSFVGGLIGAAVGDNGLILHTTTGGE